MTLTAAETTRVMGVARARFPYTQPAPIPAELAAWLRSFPPFIPDGKRPGELAPSDGTDIGAAVAFAVYGPVGTVPTERELEELVERVAQIPEGDDMRRVESVLVYGALRGWPIAGEVLLKLIRRVIRPALRWLYRRNIFEDHTLREKEWVDQEATDSGGQILHWLLGGCDCHRYARELSLQETTAQTRCRTVHALSRWDGREPLARFLCRETVCLHGYHRDAMNDFSNLESYCLHRLAVHEFRHGMLAKAVQCGTLRSGFVLRCSRSECTGEIDPTTDHCDGCNQLTEAPKPQTFWLWAAGRYRPEDCRPCQTCGFYYFRHRLPCVRQESAQLPHCWSPNKPCRVWVRTRGLGGDVTARVAEPEASLPHWAITAVGARQFRDAIRAIPDAAVRDLAAELLCEAPDPRRSAARRKRDLSEGPFLEEFLAALRAVPDLLPDIEDVFRAPDLLAIARWLFEDGLSLSQIAHRRKQKVNQKPFCEAVQETLIRMLGAVLHLHSSPLEAGEPGAVGESDPGLLEFIAGMPGQEGDYARELFGGPVAVADVAERWGLEPESDTFVLRLLVTVRAARPGLPFDPIARFGRGELGKTAELIFGTGAAALKGAVKRLRRHKKQNRFRETLLGILLNVIYGANGLTNDTPAEGEENT